MIRFVLALAIAAGAGQGTPTPSQAAPAAVAPAPKGAPAVSQETDLDRVAREVSSGLRCPVCQGTSIQDSPADLAVEMKALVREQLAAGKTPEEVRAYFVTKYGEWVLLAPAAHGMNLVVYLLPLALVLGGGWFVWRFIRTHTHDTEPTLP